MEKFHYFLYGKEFTLETDQNPLVSIYVMQPRSGEDPKLQNTLKNASYQGGRAAN